jgi:hypothetical protein
VPGAQTIPQPPQLLLSCATHFPLQRSALLEHLQLPPTQVPYPQLFLQAPQFSGSVERSTQSPLQGVFPVAQTHLPSLQMVSPTQRLPQAPQLPGSLESSVQPPAQAADPPGQAATQLDAKQISVGPHAPLQLPAQSAPLSQTHLPLAQ